MFDEEGKRIGTSLAQQENVEARIKRHQAAKKKKNSLIASVWVLGGE